VVEKRNRRRYPNKARLKRKSPASDLLILECQAKKLTGQALDFGTGIARFLKATFPKKSIVLLPTALVSELTPSLADVWNRHCRFRSILLVGHSNANGLQLTNDQFCGWDAVGRWLERFEPKSLFLAACDAGGSEAVRRLFASIPSLRDIYASPIKLYSDQTAPLATLILGAVLRRKIDNEGLRLLQAANYLITGGQLYRWRRRETGKGEELKGRLYDVAASLLHEMSKTLGAILVHRQ
jgi:hypothetical protein